MRLSARPPRLVTPPLTRRCPPRRPTAAAASSDPPPLKTRLATYGASGLASMALLNAAWYGALFAGAWATGAAPARGCGVRAALRAAALAFAFVFGASQVTKVPRGLAILACVPLVDKCLHLAAGGDAGRARRLAGAVAAACLAAVVAVVVGCALSVA